MRCICVVIVLAAGLLTGCAAVTIETPEPPTAEQQTVEMAPEARAYLGELLDIMQSHSINRLTIDWDDFRAKVFARAAGAKSIEDTRPAITEALRLLGDRHSMYFSKAETKISLASSSTAYESIKVPSTVGYVRVSGFLGGSAEATAFSDRIQQTIKSADSQGATGWIVDLRGNVGGNMWPMITGLAPLLGDGTLGYFIDPMGVKKVWELWDGVAYLDGQVVAQNKETYHIQNEASRVAVLTDAVTGSSGEAVTIAFRGRSGTRSFGTPTYGVSTANKGFDLSDGAMLYLTVSVMADRTGTPYGGPVVPDEVISDPDTVVERAMEWLKSGN
jgi:carboxyl-terminal processing protease